MGRLSSTAREQLASSGVSSCPSSAPFPSLQNRLRCVENGAKFSKKIRKNAAEKAVADDPGSSSFLLQSEGGVRQQVSKSDRSLQTRQEVRSDGTTHGESVVSCSSSSCSSPSRLLSSYPPETHAPPQHAPRVPSEADECRGRRGTRRTVASAKALRRCRVPSFRKVVTTKSKVSSTGGKRESPRKKKKTPATEKRKKDTMTSSSSSSSSSSSFSAPSGSFSRSFSSSKRKASSSISLGKEKKKNVMSAPSPPISSTCEEASDEDVRRNAVSLKTWFQQNRVDLDTLCSELAEQLPSIPPAAFSEKLQEPLSSLKELLSSWTRILTSGEEYQRDFLDRYDNYVFDIDGVLLMGKQPLTGISEALQKLRSGKKKKRLFFVTNSASKSRRICVEALRDAGIEAYVHEVSRPAPSLLLCNPSVCSSLLLLLFLLFFRTERSVLSACLQGGGVSSEKGAARERTRERCRRGFYRACFSSLRVSLRVFFTQLAVYVGERTDTHVHAYAGFLVSSR